MRKCVSLLLFMHRGAQMKFAAEAAFAPRRAGQINLPCPMGKSFYTKHDRMCYIMS